ncbi:PQQ-binding-like beta-propeller repeat protein [Paenibacillus sp. Soil522]|uniref:PQQ-binding-like beta-propeller repeat protein n=1 Tax=Paenibacillus sp. Soil522 TaxID=1736388 RepID=UPI000701B351|nr:PQQ-binding-like beta-propeller repeat protein [Paenibacillus sp. Soil522]KRE29652.1 hypothetical protein ASG81_25465 [Paenibacillus sp. Soil522]
MKKLFIIAAVFALFISGCKQETANVISEGEQKPVENMHQYFTYYPAIDKDNVYFGAGTGYIYALDKKNGKKSWSIKVEDFPHINTSIITHDDFIAYRDGVYMSGVDAQSGEPKWKIKDDPSYPSLSKDGSLYYIAYDEVTKQQSIKSADIHTGGTLWEYPVIAETISIPNEVDGVIYVGGFSYLYAYDTKNKTYWQYKINESENKSFGLIDMTPVIEAGIVAFSTGGFVYALDTQTHQLLWKHETDTPHTSHTLSVYDGKLFLGDYDTKKVVALDLKTGSVQWEVIVNGPLETPLTFVDGIVYFGGGNFAYALQASNGVEVWKSKTEGEIHSKLAVSEDIVYLGDNKGLFYAMEKNNGHKIWTYNIDTDEVQTTWRKIEEIHPKEEISDDSETVTTAQEIPSIVEPVIDSELLENQTDVDLSSLTDDTFLELVTAGKIKGVNFDIGSSTKDILQQLGNPSGKDRHYWSLGHDETLTYGNVSYLSKEGTIVGIQIFLDNQLTSLTAFEEIFEEPYPDAGYYDDGAAYFEGFHIEKHSIYFARLIDDPKHDYDHLILFANK